MKTLMPIVLTATTACLLVIGSICISTAADANSNTTSLAARGPALAAGLASLVLATGLVVFGVVTFSPRGKREG